MVGSPGRHAPTRPVVRLLPVTTLLLVLLLAMTGCGKDPAKPVFDPVGRIEGQVVYFDDEVPARLTVTRWDRRDRSLNGDRWRVDLDEEGRFDLPLPEGIYGVELTVDSDDYDNDVYLTPRGFRDYFFDPDTCGIVVDRELPPVRLEVELGRATFRLVPPFEHTQLWYLELRTSDEAIHWTRRLRRAPDGSGAVIFDVTRLPMENFVATLTTPFSEQISAPIFLGEAQVGWIRPQAQALEEYTIELPEPAWIEVRTTPVEDAPVGILRNFTAFTDPVQLGGNAAREQMSVDADQRSASCRIALLSRSPVLVYITDYFQTIFAGGGYGTSGADSYLPTPENTVEVEVEVGVLICRFTPALGFEGPNHYVFLAERNSGRLLASRPVVLDPESGIPEAEILAPPGTYDLYFDPATLESLTPQYLDRAIEVHRGEVGTFEWTLHGGVSLYGRLGTPWKPGDRLEVRRADGHSWRAAPEIGPDPRDFAIHHVPEGDLILVHDQGADRVYYPGGSEDHLAQVIHVSGTEDIHGLEFWR